MLQIGCKGNVVFFFFAAEWDHTTAGGARNGDREHRYTNQVVVLWLDSKWPVQMISLCRSNIHVHAYLPLTFICLWMFAWSSWVYNVEVYRWANANVEDSWQSWSHLAAYAQTIAHYDCLAETMFGDQGSQSSLTIPKWLTGGRLKNTQETKYRNPSIWN